MKKYFIFAAVATAGLFASCSSSDDALSQAPNVVENSEGRPAISIGIGTPAGLDTRGTGTVGGVGTGVNATPNAWHGQEINVFMFTKDANKATTLKLTPGETANSYMYNNLAMYTPGTDANKIPGMDVATASGEAMIKDGTINYYPLQGNFDFFGYHGDDAVTANPKKLDAQGAETDEVADMVKWTVPFTIDGSQDLMSTKADVTSAEAALVGADFYSAKAARKGVQPTLTFKHLLTRLSFCVVAGNDAAAGYDAGTATVSTVTAADYALLDATGQGQCVAATYDVAATVALGDWPTDPADIAAAENYWEPDAAPVTVYNRKAGVTTIAAADYDALPATLQDAKYFTVATYTRTQPAVPTSDPTAAVQIKSIKIKSKATGDLAVAWTTDLTDAEKIVWSNADAVQMTLKERAAYKRLAAAAAADGADLYDNYGTMNQTDQAAADAEAAQLEQDKISAATFAKFTATGKAKYEAITNAEKELLIALTPTSPTIDATQTGADRYPATAIGEALIVAPSTDAYEMEVEVTQKVKTNWTSSDVATKTQTQTLMIPVPANTGIGGASAGFLQNTSYNVKLTVYGFERIVVNAVVEPWAAGEEIEVGKDQ